MEIPTFDQKKREDSYPDIKGKLKVYKFVYPVPADCPVFLGTIGSKVKYLCVYGSSGWCNRCVIWKRFCFNGKILLEEDEDEKYQS